MSFNQQILAESVSSPQLHHQLILNILTVEKDFSESYVESLRKCYHDINMSYNKTLEAMQAIFKNNGVIYAVCDKQRYGQPARY